jgi:hypothetical protein
MIGYSKNGRPIMENSLHGQIRIDEASIVSGFKDGETYQQATMKLSGKPTMLGGFGDFSENLKSYNSEIHVDLQFSEKQEIRYSFNDNSTEEKIPYIGSLELTHYKEDSVLLIEIYASLPLNIYFHLFSYAKRNISFNAFYGLQKRLGRLKRSAYVEVVKFYSVNDYEKEPFQFHLL